MSLFTFRPILSSDTIGDSLSAVNQAYDQLDLFTSNIKLSSEQYWKPLATLYSQNGTAWKSMRTTIQNLSANWESFLTTVQTTSAKWLEPITLVYPYAFPDTLTNENVSEIVNWFNSTFPVLSEDRDAPNYIEGQKAVLYSYVYYTMIRVNERLTLTDSATCSTQSVTWNTPVTCSYSNIGGCCGAGHVESKSATCGVTCYVPQSFYSVSETHTPYVNNWFEQRLINAVYLVVSNCEWTLSKVI